MTSENHVQSPSTGGDAVVGPLVVHHGRAVLDDEEGAPPPSSVDDPLRKEEKGAADAAVSRNGNAAPSRSFFREHRLVLLASVGALIAAIVVVSWSFSFSPSGDGGKVDSARVESQGEVAVYTTDFPSTMPSLAPSVPPQWNLDYLGVDADFGSGNSHELVVEYAFGINREFRTEIFADDCASAVEPGNLLRLTTERSPRDDYSELLALKYDVAKGLLTSSNVWDAASSTLKICQVTSLILPRETGEGRDFVITEDMRTLDVKVDLTVGFGVGLEVALSPGEIANQTLTQTGGPDGGVPPK
eukprot:CAMPEP_0172552620 /NCGR_PEP_ID=MMETSP1067-20121228/46417_1 /TAXON_ID=265564 ORGANISM="Thalassiosira punctigera, Strain Tpunct2005C2" /NCGR_SAMPLE_ID=MMETSP1067 /ASSEMBLY_ACC=CAM_ASM_000444 /LENGTH=300 /DNA_ID=CAMNT_0013340645 /DNA_START=114 /DNA_END=1016 /DNA_ORIENTATION=+